MTTLEQIVMREVLIPAGNATVAAEISIPAEATGAVLFAHGSGSSRRSPRNRYVAAELNRGGIATVLADLMTEEEELMDLAGAQWRFDIPMLTQRLAGVVDWMEAEEEIAGLPFGIFGASTGAAAALDAAAARPAVVKAVVSRGGRPDLAENLKHVRAATLLIVGGNDPTVVALNRDAFAKLTCVKRLDVVAGATHLFEESGALERVATLARSWFATYLKGF